jgi:hypothetical protein
MTRRIRLRAIALLFVLGGCGWAHRHSAVTAGAVTGAVMGLGACEIGNGQNTTCLAYGGVAAVFLGGLAWLATTFLDTNAQAPAPPPANAQELGNGGAIRVHTRTLPPPVPIDAGAGPAATGSVADSGVPMDAPSAATDVVTPPYDATAM